MTVNSSRSMNADLTEGATDGKYRKVRPDTSVAQGMGDERMTQNRAGLHPWYNYGYITAEEPAKVNPGGV